MSMETDYSVAVKLSLVENVSRGLLSMGGKFATLNAQADVFQAKLNGLKHQLAVGAGMIAFGSAMVAPLLMATSQAGKLQNQLRMVQIATAATQDQMKDFHASISNTALGSIFNVTDVATIAKTLATAGNFNIQQVQGLLPQFVQYAQVQNLLKGTKYDKSVDQAIKLAEITGNFDPESVGKSLNALNKLSFVMPGSVDKVLSAFKYMEGTMKRIMGVSDDQSLMLVAFLQRMGMEGTRAGTQIVNFVARTIPGVFGSGLWQGKSLPNLQAMGMLGANGVPNMFTNGKVDPLKLFHNLGNFILRDFAKLPEANARTDIERKFVQTFGATGTRIASILTSPIAIKQFQEIQEAYKRVPNLDTLNENMQDLLSVQLPEAFQGLKTVFTDLGYALLPTAVSGLKSFNSLLKSIDQWINAHQHTVAIIEKGILAFSGMLIIGGLLTVVRVGLMGLIIPLQLLGLPITLVIAGVTALGVAIYEIYKHWDFLKAKFMSFITTFKPIEIAISLLNKAFTAMGNTITRIVNLVPASWTNNNGVNHKAPQNLLFDNVAKTNHLSNWTLADIFRSTARQTILPGLRAQQKSSNTMQPIHVHVNVDGRKVSACCCESYL